MKTCTNCGAKNFEVSVNCEKCGQPLVQETYLNIVSERQEERVELPTYTPYPKQAVKQKDNGLSITAKVFLIVKSAMQGIAFAIFAILWLLSLILVDKFAKSYYLDTVKTEVLVVYILMTIAFIKAIVCICMTVVYYRKIFERKKIGVAFKICTLLFVSFIAGLLMLVDAEHE